ncbi:MAG: hypothetical protein GXN93_02575 [Candidatus Diapherotrites archaeon]|nr:hypothetical protein [Candidatus Diapherotrites archaeon]
MNQDAMRAIIFGGLLLAAIIGLFFFIWAAVNQNLLVFAASLLLLAMIYGAAKSNMLVQLMDYERAVVFRFGKFVGVRGPGWVFIAPFVEEYVRVDLRVQTVDIAPQKVITKDNIQVTIDAVIYLRVVDAAKAVLAVQDYKSAAVLYIESKIREIAGGMTAEEIISNVDAINSQLRKDLQSLVSDWGVEVVSVELKSVQLPPELMEAMHEMREAEQHKLATIQRAEAEKATIEAVKQAAKDLDDRVLAYYYIRALEKIAEGRATKLVLPLEISTLSQSISSALGGAVSPKRVEQDLTGKYAYLLDEFKKMLQQKKSS